jgi:hypothetical protein
VIKTKNRTEFIFQEEFSMKKYVAVLTLAVIMLLVIAACGMSDDTDASHTNGNGTDISNAATPREDYSESTEQSTPEVGSGTLHQFPNLGFSVVFPATWEGKYGLVEHHLDDWWGTTIEVYHIATREEIGAGWLWTFRRIHEDDFIDDGEPIPHNHAIMYQGGGYAFIMQMPSDVQWDYETPDGELATEYLEMTGQWEEIASSFRLMN